MRTNVLLKAVLLAVRYDENHWSRSLYRCLVEPVVTTETSTMLKKILTGSLVCAALAIASFPAQAQSQAPASPAPIAPSTGQASEVTPQEVQQFANALKQMRSIHDEAQTQAGQIIQGQGLTVQRFNEILQSQQTAQAQPSGQPPNSQPPSGQSPSGQSPSTPAQPAAPASPEEQQKFDQAMTQITQIQQSVEQRMGQAITSAGLEVQRFNQIFTIARQDQGLKQRIEQVLQN
jgi:Domain of unknown function (DUF4168)